MPRAQAVRPRTLSLTQEPSAGSQELSWRTHNIGRALFSASYVFVQDELRAVNQTGSVGLTQAQMALFQNLDAEGASLTRVATRAKMTKQAMQELVDKAERLGLVYRCADPDDGRAKLVKLTDSGLETLERLGEGVAAAEARLAGIVGADFVESLKLQLGRYVARVSRGRNDPCATISESKTSAWRADNVGRVPDAATGAFVGEAMRVVHQSGLDGVRDVHMALYRNLDLNGARLTVVAQRAQMTKQAMLELVDRTETLGFVERLPDPKDGRAKIIRFTAAGLGMLDRVREGLAQAEAAFEDVTGSVFVRQAKRRLAAYVDAADVSPLIGIDRN